MVSLQVTAARAHYAVGSRHGDAVGKWAWESAGVTPHTIGLVEEQHAVAPDFPAAFPRHFVGEIRATRDEQRAATHAGKRGGQPDHVGQWRELFPLQRFGSREPRTQREDQEGARPKSRGSTEAELWRRASRLP